MQEPETKVNINISFRSYYLYARIFLLLLLTTVILLSYYPKASNLHPTNQILEETKIVIERGDTLRSVLSKFSMSEQEISQIIEITASVYDLRKIQIGQILRVYYTFEDDQKILQKISLKLNNDKKIEIYRQDEEFKLREIFIPLKKDIVKLSANIDSSIFGAAEKSGIPRNALIEAINAYSYSVDFQRDIQPNDTFNVLIETFNTEDGKFSHHGKVIFSSFSFHSFTSNFISFLQEIRIEQIVISCINLFI